VTVNSYSVVIETENLSMADNACLWDCLDSLQVAIAKTAPPLEAWLLNTGDVSPAMMATLAEKYPWVTLVQSPPGENYYETKMRGALLSTSAIVVFADSDCTYNPDWLVGLLEPFEDNRVRIVAGETGFCDAGPYGLALSIAHSFDGYSEKNSLYRVNNYYANNVAFRRSVLVDLPIPLRLPLYRHSCSAHCMELRRRGETIWAQPRSRAAHASPEGLSHFYWRFLLFGRDRAIRARLQLIDDAPKVDADKTGVIHVVSRRLGRALRFRPTQWMWIPAASFIVLIAFILIRVGQVLSRLNPQLAIEHFGSIEGVRYPTMAEFQQSKAAGSSPGA
jgi:hypothetical protein